MMINRLLFKQIDNSALVAFRVFFGLLLFLEAVGAIFTGWIKRTLIGPQFTFSFIGFEWLQPLPGNGMYFYYALMGIFGLMVMLGYKYRIGIIAFTIMWSATYFMQKASYNNHYYLLILICLIMAILPANRYFSLDAKYNPAIRSNRMPSWCTAIIILQLFIVYTFAAIAKIYPDWLNLTVAENLMAARKHYYVIGDIIQQKWFHYVIAYAGILFDLLIVPLLLWKPTRKWAFFAAIFFHLFNSIVFQIGIFPYLSLAFTLFFFEPKTIQKLFFKKKDFYNEAALRVPKYKPVFLIALSVYFIIQLALPLRHWFIKDNVLWTEEGHRLAWRMMLRSKRGYATFKVVDNKTGDKAILNVDDYLTPKQKRLVLTHPDVLWQFVQKIKQLEAEKGHDISMFVDAKVSVNGKPFKAYIDPEVDLTKVKWNAFKHSDWILPSE